MTKLSQLSQHRIYFNCACSPVPYFDVAELLKEPDCPPTVAELRDSYVCAGCGRRNPPVTISTVGGSGAAMASAGGVEGPVRDG